jgi:hypothetical protein
VRAGQPAAEVIGERLARMRDDAGRPILPMAPGTALCLACPWVPWPWQDLPADVQARQHSQQAGHPTLYPPRQPATSLCFGAVSQCGGW